MPNSVMPNGVGPYARIAIIGKTGAGKTTLARQLACILSAKNVELDAINWQPNWTQIPIPEFRTSTSAALSSSPRWITDGNYRHVRDIIWTQADTVIWLDYGLLLTLWRLLKRTTGRVVRGKELWNGNVENGWSFLRPDCKENLFIWAVRKHWAHRREYPVIFAEERYRHLRVLRFRSPGETEEWVRSLRKSVEESQIDLRSVKSGSEDFDACLNG